MFLFLDICGQAIFLSICADLLAAFQSQCCF
jgi:hypothetical protein